MGKSYCLTVPYTQLDERTLHFVRSSRIENMENILLSIEENNRLQEIIGKERSKEEFASFLESNMMQITKF